MGNERPVFGTLSLYEAMAEALNDDPAWVDKGANITASMTYSFLTPIDRLFFLNFDHGKIKSIYSAMFYPPDDLPVPNWPPYEGNFPIHE